MKFFWHISALFFLLVLGGRMEHPANSPNQEIVLEFQENLPGESGASELIQNITRRLNDIGITQVQVIQTEKGVFKILYFSSLEVYHIKDLLKDGVAVPNLPSGIPTQIPNEKHSYKLEIVKIQDSDLFENSLQGILVEVKSVPDQYVKPKLPLVFATLVEKWILPVPKIENVTFILPVHTHESVYYAFPEVRAGPWA
ncbi:MAG TPA: hypothetical protein VFF21_01650 [Flavobacteriaceae bacterium]|nr:hypothetical protein [Flavobacteriaceae bacterium]